MSSFIKEYLTKSDCNMVSGGGNNFNCEHCGCIEICYGIANMRCISEFAERLNYGGYNTEEEFWENLLD